MKKTSSLKDTNILSLPDGRRLGYAEYGDPNGKPVMLFHGNPNSRLLLRGGLYPKCRAHWCLLQAVPNQSEQTKGEGEIFNAKNLRLGRFHLPQQEHILLHG